MRSNFKILLAEDDLNLGTILKEFLEIKGLQIDLCNNGEIALEQFNKNSYDICILDIMMPKKDGFSLAKDIRTKDSEIPIIFLTAKSLPEDRIEGFRLGGDDYVTKPFSTEELLFRINAIMKRVVSGSNANSGNTFTIGTYKFDYDKRILFVNEIEQKLTSKESELLKLLCEHKHKILERSKALNIVWHEDSYFTGRSMDVYVAKLRKYLDADPKVEIVNIHGQGFKLID